MKGVEDSFLQFFLLFPLCTYVNLLRLKIEYSATNFLQEVFLLKAFMRSGFWAI